MIKFNGKNYDLYFYEGQHYNQGEYGLTVAIIEDTTEVFLVPYGKPGYQGYRRLLIENLHNYLNDMEEPWLLTHTVHGPSHCTFKNNDKRIKDFLEIVGHLLQKMEKAE